MNRKNKKRMAALAFIVLLLAIAAVAFTLAAPTARTTNVITTGKVDIALGDEVPRETNITVMPGVTVQQPITVKNEEDAAEAYVRVKLEVSDVTKVDGTKPDSAELDPLLNLGGPEKDPNWLKGEDGWWYYAQNGGVLAADAQTEALTLSLQFDGPNTGNDYQGATGKIRVVAEAVQVKNNPIPDAGDVTDVFKNSSGEPIKILPREEWVDEPAQENNQEGGSNV